MRNGFLLQSATLAALAAILFAVSPSAAAADDTRRLSSAEIKRLVTGKVVTDEVHYTDRFQRGGKYEGVFMNKRRSGAWEVKDNLLCITSGSEPPDCDAFWGSRKAPRRLLRGKPEFPNVRDTIVVRSE